MPKELDDGQADGIEPEVAEIEGLATLKQSLVDAEVKAEANLAGWQRAQADFVNYKRRMEQERGEISQFTKAMLILDLLPALDDLERALAATPPRLTKTGWVDGIRLIWGKLKSTLETQGLSEIKTVGEAFDPYLHEAVRQDKGKEGMVIEEVQKGYKFNDKVIRPSKVVVGGGEDEPEKEE